MHSFARKAFFAVALLTLVLLPQGVFAAVLSITPTSGTFEVGDRVTVKVQVSSGAPINAISGVISFPTTIFSVESVSKAGSILNFWVSEPNFSQGAGTLQFEGVALGGFNGGTGTVVTATLQAIKPGAGSVSFKSGQVLANDGQGTDVTDGKTGATYSVEVAKEPVKPVLPKPKIPTVPTIPVETEIVQPEPSLEAPEIVLSTKFGEQAVSGTSVYPNSQVLLTFVSESGVKIFITGTTDSLGQFLLLVPQTLKRGSYKVHAIVIQEDFSNSLPSNEITIQIGNILSDIGSEIRWAILLLILTLLYLIVRSYQHLKKNERLKFFVRKEAQEAEKIVHKSFKILHEDAGSPRQIKKDLDDAEDLINKEIKDIERL